MASLISPGVSVTVSDESQYTPTAAGSVAFVLLATAQDKATPTGALATATTKANANKLNRITSQRDLVLNYGNITFRVDSSDNPIHGDERNEYGLLAAYSALGVANSLYVQRADVDLDQLSGTSIRPTGEAADGTYWLDISTSGTNWGILEWSADALTFDPQTPRIISDKAQLVNAQSNAAPLSSVGAIGEYAVNVTNSTNPVWYKRYDNTWVKVGGDDWKTAVPTLVGGEANPGITSGYKLVLNGVNVTVSGTTIDDAVDAINNAFIQGVIATKNSTEQIEIRVDSTSASSGNVALPDGLLVIAKGTTIGAGDLAQQLGLFTTAEAAAGNTITKYGPTIQFSDYRDRPAWLASDDFPRPYGSVWFNTKSNARGANWSVKRWNTVTQSWEQIAAPLYASDNAAIYNMDRVGGGATLAAGTLYVKYDADDDNTGTFKLYRKAIRGLLKITGTSPTSPFNFSAGDSFIMEVSVPGTLTTQSATILLTGGDSASFVADILRANLPNIVAQVESSGAISISHLAGGTIQFDLVQGTPLTQTGLLSNSYVQTLVADDIYLASPFTPLIYTYSATEPYADPADDTLWYYSNPFDVDILVHDGSGWQSYRTVTNDARGYNLTVTDVGGPILSASKPIEQTNGSQLQPGTLWVDTGDLENYPTIYRYNGATWDLIDNTDQESVDGIVFADARWSIDGEVDPVTGDLDSIADLALADPAVLDSDAPDYQLYPRGTLLWNTRRSGYNVKRFESQQFANDDVPPTVLATWVSHSGLDQDGVPYFGHKAQRNVVVEALKASIESSTALREEQVEFNLIVCPGYPELITNMITLNNDRKQTAFIIGDSPLDLIPANVESWIKNSNLAADNGNRGLVSRSEYVGIYYPAGLGTDLAGESVVVPPSHMMLRTIIRSDNVSYPWFAPAGVRRGVIDNASSIGYIDTADNNLWRTIGVTVGLRDVLYAENVNPLTVLPGVGLVAYGQKTRSSMTSAMDRVNVARLICYLRLVLDKVARPFIFEPNDTITRNQVKSSFEAVLNDLIAKRGLYDYLVVCDTSNNTPDRIDRNELYVDIAIKPVKAIEFIYVPVRIVNTGADLAIT